MRVKDRFTACSHWFFRPPFLRSPHHAHPARPVTVPAAAVQPKHHQVRETLADATVSGRETSLTIPHYPRPNLTLQSPGPVSRARGSLSALPWPSGKKGDFQSPQLKPTILPCYWVCVTFHGSLLAGIVRFMWGFLLTNKPQKVKLYPSLPGVQMLFAKRSNSTQGDRRLST